ncbi:CLUMA_CG017316, isoform A [Clunio marinus]|uniref:CLUMA_CG017316, isoform A n=1 Tax=Clunio marinus TaxID=568069 RepID=A0A1J1IWW8_9DIPT|nr:CLUMA_CG017316, isoform A [Clunio marinus]
MIYSDDPSNRVKFQLYELCKYYFFFHIAERFHLPTAKTINAIGFENSFMKMDRNFCWHAKFQYQALMVVKHLCR